MPIKSHKTETAMNAGSVDISSSVEKSNTKIAEEEEEKQRRRPNKTQIKQMNRILHILYRSEYEMWHYFYKYIRITLDLKNWRSYHNLLL